MILEKVSQIIASNLKVPAESLTAETDLKEIGADSLDMVEIIMEIEDAFGITVGDDDALNIKTLGDAVKYIESKK